MEFDYTKLKEQLEPSGFRQFINWFDNNQQKIVIEALKTEEVYIINLNNDISQTNNSFKTVSTFIAFEKMEDNSIQVYIHENEFINLI